MNAKQIDPKYHVEATSQAQIVKTSNGQPIPDDEPLILFRARDRIALSALETYADVCEADGCTDYHLEGIRNRIEAFKQFAQDHPNRMKQPGVTRGA